MDEVVYVGTIVATVIVGGCSLLESQNAPEAARNITATVAIVGWFVVTLSAVGGMTCGASAAVASGVKTASVSVPLLLAVYGLAQDDQYMHYQGQPPPPQTPADFL